jgi:hypothetical protein
MRRELAAVRLRTMTAMTVKPAMRRALQVLLVASTFGTRRFAYTPAPDPYRLAERFRR